MDTILLGKFEEHLRLVMKNCRYKKRWNLLQFVLVRYTEIPIRQVSLGNVKFEVQFIEACSVEHATSVCESVTFR